MSVPNPECTSTKYSFPRPQYQKSFSQIKRQLPTFLPPPLPGVLEGYPIGHGSDRYPLLRLHPLQLLPHAQPRIRPRQTRVRKRILGQSQVARQARPAGGANRIRVRDGCHIWAATDLESGDHSECSWCVDLVRQYFRNTPFSYPCSRISFLNFEELLWVRRTYTSDALTAYTRMHTLCMDMVARVCKSTRLYALCI